MVALGLAAIVTPFVVTWWHRGYKALSYTMISFPTSLLTSEEKVEEQDVHRVIVEIVNSGNTEIRPADYESPVNLSFSGNAHVLTVEVSKKNPTNLPATIYKENKTVVLREVLLNPGDSIELQCTVSQFDGRMDVYGRIAGVRAILKSAQGRFRFRVLFWGGTFLLVFGAIKLTGVLFFRQPFPEPFYFPHILPYLSSMVLGYLLILVGIVRYSEVFRILKRLF